jgi:hypothetical protein
MGMGQWSMAKDRLLIKLIGKKLSVDKIAAEMEAPYLTVIKAARRLGIKLGPQPPRPNGRFKAKGI